MAWRGYAFLSAETNFEARNGELAEGSRLGDNPAIEANPSMAAFLLIVLVVALVGALIYVMGSPGPHEEMTEEEFEEEAKKKSLLRAGMIGLQKVLEPNRIEHVLEQEQRVEKDAGLPGEPPPEDEVSKKD